MTMETESRELLKQITRIADALEDIRADTGMLTEIHKSVEHMDKAFWDHERGFTVLAVETGR